MSSSDEEGHETDEQQEEQQETTNEFTEEQEYYDEEEDDEDEELNNQSKKKKKKKSLLQQFIVEEAEDDDQEEEEEEEEPEDGYYQVLKEQERDERETHRDMNSHRELYNRMEREDNAEELANYFKQRYSRQNENERFGQSDQLSDTIIQQKLLPGVKDPNLWTVKCKSGEEKATALWLMRKYNAFLNKTDKQPLAIKSVIVKEGLRGFIYIEAYKQTHVKAAIDEISNLRMGQWKQEMVPFKEMPDVLRVIKDCVKLKPGSWVRMKRTIWKDDLAQVEHVDMAQNQVILKLIPRIDYNQKRGIYKDTESQKDDKTNPFKRKVRPPQRLFDYDSITKIGGMPMKEKENWIFENNRYTPKGFLIKNFPLSTIMTEGVKPTLSELQRFEESPEGVDSQTAELLSKTALDRSHNFVPGDIVEVCQGELIHLNGTIIGIDGERVRMMPNHEELKEPMTFMANELRKYFKIGEHVKVIGGRNEGETGLIVRVDDNVAIILSDLTMEEITVFQRFLQLCQATATGVDALGHFEWGDLVQIDSHTMGIIVRLEKETFRILTMNGKIVNMKHSAISKKRLSKFAQALDSEGKSITQGDIVKIIDGLHKGQQGQIKYIYRHYAFIHSKTFSENGGYFVCTTRQILMSSSNKTSVPGGSNMGNMTPGFMSPRVMASPAYPTQNGGASSTRGGMSTGTHGGNTSQHGSTVGKSPAPQQRVNAKPGTRRNTTLIGKTVRITQGPYKGYVGIVKDATDTTARVELHTKCQTISVDLVRLTIVDNAKMFSRTPGGSFATPVQHGGQTPMHSMSGSRTPMYGSQTPMHDGSRTPHYGGATPRYDGGATPSANDRHSSAWDPTSTVTPRNDFEDDWDDQPPSANLNPTTPGYQAETPESHAGPFTPGSALNYVSHSPYTNPSPMDGYQQNVYSNQVPTPGSNYTSNSPASFGQNYMYSPATPGAYFAPQTPGGNAYNLEHSDWHMDGLIVRIKNSYPHDPDFCGAEGVIRSIHGSQCSLHLKQLDKTINISLDYLEPVLPHKGDKVMIIHGDDKGSIGLLLSIDGADGVVKLENRPESRDEITMTNIKLLCKVPNN